MHYQKYTPTKLNNLVLSIFERKVNVPMKVQMLPDHTISLIFYIGEKIESVKGKQIDSNFFNPTDHFCFITGLHTESLYFDMEGLHSIGLNMYPSAIKAFWNIPVKEFKDAVVNWEMEGELAFIEDNIRGLPDFMQRALWLEDYFYNKLKKIDISFSWKLNKMISQLERDVFMGVRPDINNYTGYSKMHTHRIFNEWLGLTPGKLLRFKQYLKAIQLIHQTDWSLTQIGYECGFYDQSHFIRVFEEFAQMTPGTYQKKKGPIPGILMK